MTTAFGQNDADAARCQWRPVTGQLRPKMAKLAASRDDAEADVLTCVSFLTRHRAKLHCIKPLERLYGEIKGHSEVVGIFPTRTRRAHSASIRLHLRQHLDGPRPRRLRHRRLCPPLRPLAGEIATPAALGLVPQCDGVSLSPLERDALLGQVLHGSAKTTHAVRAELQRSQASSAELARRFGINEKTVRKWRSRRTVVDEPMGPKERHSSTLSAIEEAAIVALRVQARLPLDDVFVA